MPSPVGHALGGLAAGWLIAGAPASLPSFRSAHASGSSAGRRGPASTRPGPASSASGSAAPEPWTATWRGAIVFASLGMLPDVDLAVGLHSMYTHSVGAALIVMLAAMALTPDTPGSPASAASPVSAASFVSSAAATRVATGLACGAAYASHILLDWLGNDTTPPIGIMALWPFSPDYYESNLHWFMAITRRYWLPGFWTHNLLAAAREVGTLGLVAAAIYWLRRRK